MEQGWVRNYIENYLKINQCNIIESEPSYLKVKLSTNVDKDLTNRHYYWTFVERTGTTAETMTMTFIFDSEKPTENIRGEEIRFGSERLKQIFHSAKKRGKIIRLYQQKMYNTLNPWLGVNYKVEFISDKKKDLLLSLGIDLATGKMIDNFFNHLKTIRIGPVLPANVSTNPPFITFREAVLQLEEKILHEIGKESFNWAYEANKRLDEELKQLEAYYVNYDANVYNKETDDQSNPTVEKAKRIEEIKWQYAPKIKVAPINYGIFYLADLVQKNSEYVH